MRHVPSFLSARAFLRWCLAVALSVVLLCPVFAEQMSAGRFFSLTVPAECPGWEIRSSDSEETPLLIVTAHSADGLPFISTFVAYFKFLPLDVQEVWGDPQEVFAMKIAADTAFEKEALPDMLVIREEYTALAGLPAYHQIFMSNEAQATYHLILVMFPEGIVSFLLNARTDSFDAHDEAFLAIMGTLRHLNN